MKNILRKITGTHYLIAFFILVAIVLSVKVYFSTAQDGKNGNNVLKMSQFTYTEDFFNNKDFYLKDIDVNWKDVFELERSENLQDSQILIKSVLPVITSDSYYIVVNIKNEYKSKLKLYIDGKEIKTVHPNTFRNNPLSDFAFYILSELDSYKEIYFYGDIPTMALVNAEASANLGSIENVVFGVVSDSFYNSICSIILIILSLSVLIVFYITSSEKYYSVQFLSIMSFLLAIEIALNSRFTLLILNNFSLYIDILNIYIYFAFSIGIYFIAYFNNKRRVSVKSIEINTIISSILIIGIVIYSRNDYHKFLEASLVFFLYQILVYLTAAYLVIKNTIKDKNMHYFINILATLSFMSINLLFYLIYIRKEQYGLIRLYYFFIFAFVFSVVLHVFRIFSMRNATVEKIKNDLMLEQRTIKRISNSGENGADFFSIKELSKNIASDILSLFSNCNFCFIAFENEENGIDVVFKTEQHETIIPIVNEHFFHVKKSNYKNDFIKNKGYLTFSNDRGDSLYIYIELENDFTPLDQMACKIFSSPLLSRFRNSRIYDDIDKTEKELLLAIGKIIYDRGKTIGNCEVVGEFCYLMAKEYGMSENDAKDFQIASYIHNIGKIGISDNYIDTEKMTQTSKKYFLEHTVIGYDILSKLDGRTMEIGALCSRDHHEHYDGSGYLKKSGNNINIFGRIISIASGFDSHFVNYRTNETQEQSLALAFRYLSDNKQTIFDPNLVDLFLRQKNRIIQILDKYNY